MCSASLEPRKVYKVLPDLIGLPQEGRELALGGAIDLSLVETDDGVELQLLRYRGGGSGRGASRECHREGDGAETHRPGALHDHREQQQNRQAALDRGPGEAALQPSIDIAELVVADQIARFVEGDEVPHPSEGGDIGDRPRAVKRELHGHAAALVEHRGDDAAMQHAGCGVADEDRAVRQAGPGLAGGGAVE